MLSYRRAIRGRDVHAVVVANPTTTLPRTKATRILYVTDDWVAGASLMGLDRTWVSAILDRNVGLADAFAVVSPPLAQAIRDRRPSAPIAVIPNGAPAATRVSPSFRAPTAGLIGQINERIDLSLLEATADAGVALRIVGPRTSRDGAFNARFDRLVARETVDWRGAVEAQEIPVHLSEISVGLTPYTQTRFNRASSPLKTLEYLAAGVPVVSSDLPASRWLNTDDVIIGADSAEFVAAVRAAIRAGNGDGAEARRRHFADQHSWRRRAFEMLALIEAGGRTRAAPDRTEHDDH